MLGAVIGGIFGGISGLWEADARRHQLERQIEARRKAAKYKYSGIEAAATLMREQNRESSMNLVQEAFRAGGATERDAQREISKGSGKIAVKRGESLARGLSKAREMTAYYMEAHRALSKMDQKTTSVINTITQQMDERTNRINNRQIQAYQEMVGVLTSDVPSVEYGGRILNGVFSGVGAGAGLRW